VAGDGEIFLQGAGASPEGDRPFLDRFDLETGKATRLFHSEAPYYESVQAMLDREGKRLLTTRETPTEVPNLYVRDLAAGDDAVRALTDYPHPTPELRDVTKEQIRYTRADGVALTGELYLPAGYDPARDGPLRTPPARCGARRCASMPSAIGGRWASSPAAMPCSTARRCRSWARATPSPTTPTSSSWSPVPGPRSTRWCAAAWPIATGSPLADTPTAPS